MLRATSSASSGSSAAPASSTSCPSSSCAGLSSASAAPSAHYLVLFHLVLNQKAVEVEVVVQEQVPVHNKGLNCLRKETVGLPLFTLNCDLAR